LSSLSDLRLARIAVIGALVAALGLAGCGRKGGLDPPPAGASIAQEAAMPGGPEPGIGADGRPVAPRGARQPTPIDWLID
jgi:predicted small lipoprotein YifL